MSPLAKRLSSLLVLIALAFAALSAAWLYLSASVSSSVDDWIAAEASRGRAWSCAQRTIDGYPLTLRFVCTGATLRASGGPVTHASLPAMSAAASIFSPTRIAVTAAGPVEARMADGGLARAEWRRLSGEGGLARGGDLALHAEGWRGTVTSGGGAEQSVRADALSARAAPVADRIADAGAWELHIDGRGVDWSGRSDVIAARGPLAIEARAVVTNAGALLPEPTPLALDAWREAGGRFNLTNAKVSDGAWEAGATADLTIDDARRLAGAVDLWSSSAAPFEPILQNLKGSAASAARAALGGLSGGGGPNGVLRAPLRLADGRVRIGFIPTPIRLAPLY